MEPLLDKVLLLSLFFCVFVLTIFSQVHKHFSILASFGWTSNHHAILHLFVLCFYASARPLLA